MSESDSENDGTPMQVLLHAKWCNCVALYAPLVPAKYAEKMRKIDFAKLVAAISTYGETAAQLTTEELLTLAEKLYPDERPVELYQRFPPDAQEKLPKYIQFFWHWYQEYVKPE